MAHIDDLIIKIKAILDSGGFDQAANKVQSVGNEANKVSNNMAKMGNDGRSSFMQIQYGADNALSSVNRNMQSVNSNSSGLWSNLKSGASSAWSSIKEGASSAASSIANNFSAAKSHVSDLFNSMSGIEGMATAGIGALAGGQVYDLVVNTSAKAETNKVLLNNMTQTQKGATNLFNTVDNATNKTLVSMQSVIPALNAFKAATNANEVQLNNTAAGVAQFGSFVYAMTGSAAKAETAMFDLSKGIKGAYASLDQYGITEDALMRTNIWNGKESDVEGYIKAVNKVTGSTDELMETFTGIEATVSKLFSIAGKKLGAVVLPILKNFLEDFIRLNEMMGGNLAPTILGVAGALAILATGLGIISAIMPAASALWGIFTSLLGINSAATTVNTASRVANVAATTANTGSLAGNTASFTTNTTSIVANTAATSANNAASAAASATGMGLSATLGIIAVAAIALAVAFIYLKTQTNLLDTASDKANKSMKGMNYTMDLLSKQQEAASTRANELKEKLNKLSKGSYEYEVTWKNYQNELSKIDTMQKKIDELQGKKDYISSTVLNSQSTLQRYNDAKNAAGETPATTSMAFDGGQAMMNQVAKMNYYNSYLSKSIKNNTKLSDAEKKTFDGQRLSQFNDKLAEVADLETRITDDIANGKDPSWLDQAKLSTAKKELEDIAGITSGDTLETKKKKLDAMSSGDASHLTDTSKKFLGIDIPDWLSNFKWPDLPDINKWLGDVGKQLGDAIKGALENIPILGDLAKLFDKGSQVTTKTGNDSPTSSQVVQPLSLSSFISPWGVGDWAGKVTNWSNWPSKITQWTGWSGKINQWTDWKSKITQWVGWAGKIDKWSNWSSKITAVNLANFVKGVFGAGGDEIGAGGDDISSVSTSSVSTKNSTVKNSKSSKKIVFSPVIKDNNFGNDITLDELYDGLMARFWEEIEARG